MSSPASTLRMAETAQPETVALFVSDVHLQSALPRTTAGFLAFLRHQARRTQRLYLLGDMFEYWAGDDDRADPYYRTITTALREVGAAGIQVYWLAGNRDFLVGPDFAADAGLQLLQEPHVAILAGRRLVLLHGDAQCSDDTGYMAFRRQVRQPEWQAAFLARPLGERKQIIEGMRSGSQAAQRDKSYEIMDVNRAEIDAVFAATDAELMIHGHTHRPGVHAHEAGVRYVLQDWDLDAEPARGGWLALHHDGSLHAVDAATPYSNC